MRFAIRWAMNAGWASASSLVLIVPILVTGMPRVARGQDVPSPPLVEPIVRNTTRAEFWRYYDPPPSSPAAATGDPTTRHIGNRLLAGVRMRKGPLDATAAVQYV